MKEKSKEYFLSKVSVGSTIAFIHNESIKCGKVIEIKDDRFVVRTKSCSIYFPKKNDFVWLKTGNHWPEGIHNALMYESKKSTYKINDLA